MSSRQSLAAFLPIVLKTAIEMRAAQCQDRVGSPDGPEHSRLFEARADDGLASSFDHTRANKQVLAAKLGITHPLGISLEVISLGANLLGQWGITGGDGPQCSASVRNGENVLPFKIRRTYEKRAQALHR